LKNHDKIKFLNLSKNKLKNLEGVERLTNLEVLLLADNEITSLRGLSNMPNLKKLDLSGCQLAKLHSIPDLPSLQTLIMDRCPISRPKELNNLKKLKQLSDLSMNEVDLGGSDVRKEILHNLLEFFPKLATINGEKISEEDYEEIKTVKAEKE
jgi:protein phosphatase 1 regulatory subunit 7